MQESATLVTRAVEYVFGWTDRFLWLTVGLFVMGSTARLFIGNEPFVLRRFIGEMLLSIIGAVVLWSFGMLQGMTQMQIVLLGGLGSLGGVRLIEWIMKIVKTISQNSPRS